MIFYTLTKMRFRLSSLGLVKLVHCLVCFMWSPWVSSDSGKCLVKLASVRPGKVVRCEINMSYCGHYCEFSWEF